VPKGYVFLLEAIRDPAGMGAYAAAAGPTLAEYGGSILVLSGDAEVVEGDWPATQTVVVEFESVERAREWYRSPGYQAAAELRHAAADTNVAIVSGFAPPTSA
jgi:uncharacterized protein (DUF1330 family)